MHGAHARGRGARWPPGCSRRRRPARSAPARRRSPSSRARLDLREDLALLGEDVRAGLHAGRCGLGPTAPPSAARRRPAARRRRRARRASPCGALALWADRPAGRCAVLAALGARGAFAAGLRAPCARRPRGRAPGRDLALCGELLPRIEAERPAAPRLAGAARGARQRRACRRRARIAQLERLVDLLDARRNQLFAPIAALLLWTTQLRARDRGVARRHAAAPSPAGSTPSASSRRSPRSPAYAYEHPDDPLPRARARAAPLFEARGARPSAARRRSRCVRNDVRLGGEPRACSSSAARTCRARARCCAPSASTPCWRRPARRCAPRACALSPLQVGTSMRIHDSLQAGTSRFYAEITRLRQLDRPRRAAAPPLLFLLDEILHGTNSHDRRIGAEAVVRGLVARGAIGLVTTHDLALARIADALAPARRQRPLRGPPRGRRACASTTACAPASSRRATPWS